MNWMRAVAISVMSSIAGIAGLPLTAWAWAAGPNDAEQPTVLTTEQIEADWLRQDQVRTLPARGRSVTTPQDAAGGCDGVKDGRWGFHTGRDQSPWWQVDLGRTLPIGQVMVYNRCDGSQERALHLKLLLSTNGKQWSQVYQHDGTMFGGAPDGKPLVVQLDGPKARFVRVQLPGRQYLHLDEVEVYPTTNNRNVALGKPADQSSVSPWSFPSPVVASTAAKYPVEQVLGRGLKLAASLRRLGADVADQRRVLDRVAQQLKALGPELPAAARRDLYLRARWAVRRMAFVNPLLDFDSLVFVKGVPTSFTHMSDQNYGWFSRPGGGLFVLEGFKSRRPRLRCLTGRLPEGSIIHPDLSYDGRRILFAHCRFYAGLAEVKNKLDKSRIAEDAFYHLYEINVDGSGLRRLTHGKYDDFAGRYLPDGRIVFLSTRRGQFIQAGRTSAAASCQDALPDCYVRCGGGPERPVAVYTLHVMDRDGENMQAISPFENFEWPPTVANDGRLLYARWDYVDRDNMPYMGLWSTLPDGTAAQAVFGNHTVSPYSVFEARSIPGSHKIVFTASAHHSITGGSLVLLDPNLGLDGPGPMTRLTPEVPFPEVEGWPATYFANPYPLSEQYYLTAWSDQPLAAGWPRVNPPNALGLYLYDAFGNLELIYRDAAISSMWPLPLRARPRPPAARSAARAAQPGSEGRMLLLDVYQGLASVPRGSVRRLRIVGIPAKTQPTMNSPSLGVTRDDPGKFVLGTVPVEPDGSAFFRVPAGLPFFMQALDADGMAVQTMRSAAYVQPGQTYTCVGCHEPRHTSPPNRLVLALKRPPSKITPGPDGSWPLAFDRLVQPVLDRHCLQCHRPGTDGEKIDLTPAKSYQTLVNYGTPSLRTHVLTRYRQGRSQPGACAAQVSPLLKLLRRGHYDVSLGANDYQRLITWIDTYGQRAGSFSPDQERRLRELRRRIAAMLD